MTVGTTARGRGTVALPVRLWMSGTTVLPVSTSTFVRRNANPANLGESWVIHTLYILAAILTGGGFFVHKFGNPELSPKVNRQRPFARIIEWTR